MISTLWRDGYGTVLELFDNGPEVCPDGEVRRWVDVTVTEDEFAADKTVVALRVEAVDLAELAGMLAEVAEAVAR